MQGLLFRVLPESTERLVAAVASMEGRECCDLCSEARPLQRARLRYLLGQGPCSKRVFWECSDPCSEARSR